MNFKRFLTFESTVKTPEEALRVLGIESAEDAKKAYRKLAMLHHPDRGGSEERFKEIKSAYELLSKHSTPSKQKVEPSSKPSKPQQGRDERENAYWNAGKVERKGERINSYA